MDVVPRAVLRRCNANCEHRANTCVSACSYSRGWFTYVSKAGLQYDTSGELALCRSLEDRALKQRRGSITSHAVLRVRWRHVVPRVARHLGALRYYTPYRVADKQKTGGEKAIEIKQKKPKRPLSQKRLTHLLQHLLDLVALDVEVHPRLHPCERSDTRLPARTLLLPLLLGESNGKTKKIVLKYIYINKYRYTPGTLAWIHAHQAELGINHQAELARELASPAFPYSGAFEAKSQL